MSHSICFSKNEACPGSCMTACCSWRHCLELGITAKQYGANRFSCSCRRNAMQRLLRLMRRCCCYKRRQRRRHRQFFKPDGSNLSITDRPASSASSISLPSAEYAGVIATYNGYFNKSRYLSSSKQIRACTSGVNLFIHTSRTCRLATCKCMHDA